MSFVYSVPYRSLGKQGVPTILNDAKCKQEILNSMVFVFVAVPQSWATKHFVKPLLYIDQETSPFPALSPRLIFLHAFRRKGRFFHFTAFESTGHHLAKMQYSK